MHKIESYVKPIQGKIMQCSKFPDRPAAGVCAYSGKPYSAEELVEVQGRMYAKDNLSQVFAEFKDKQNNQTPMVFMNAGGSAASAASSGSDYLIGTKSKLLAILLALFLGGFGLHKFYLGQPFWGITYLLFCWTFIPSIIAFIEAIGYMFMSDANFARAYG